MLKVWSFEDFPSDAGEIVYRLHPIDVGFDLRVDKAPIAFDETDSPYLLCSCSDDDGNRVVIEGERELVIYYLRKRGYSVLED